jgi:hypothetical protein
VLHSYYWATQVVQGPTCDPPPPSTLPPPIIERNPVLPVRRD